MKTIISTLSSLSATDLTSLNKALRSEIKSRSAQTASLRPTVGAQVRILRGKDKYAGQVGTAVVVRKTRCFVQVPGIESPAYVLTSDLEMV